MGQRRRSNDNSRRFLLEFSSSSKRIVSIITILLLGTSMLQGVTSKDWRGPSLVKATARVRIFIFFALLNHLK